MCLEKACCLVSLVSAHCPVTERAPHSFPGSRQAALSVPLRRATLGVWDALELLGTLREYETALLEEEGLDPTLALHEHAGQTAEACRAAFPDLDWLHLVGLLHSLGKLLAHKRCAPARLPARGERGGAP